MKYRKGIAAVVFRLRNHRCACDNSRGLDSRACRRGQKKEFLVLHRIQNWRGWEFPKGGRKKGESESGCLKREMFEELGTKKYKIAARTKYRLKYEWPKSYAKDGDVFGGVDDRLFIIEFLGGRIRYDKNEHNGFKWLSPEDARKKLTYADQKKAFDYATEILKRVAA